MKIEQALSILGKDFEDFKVKGNVAHSPKFSICYHYSKMYDGKPASGSTKIRIKKNVAKLFFTTIKDKTPTMLRNISIVFNPVLS